MKALLTINAGAHTVKLQACTDAGVAIAGSTQIVNMGENTVIYPLLQRNQHFNYTTFNQWGAVPVGTNPGEYPPMPNFLPEIDTWKVRIITSSAPEGTLDVVIPTLFSVNGGAPYANTAAGADAAVLAIAAAIP